PPPPEPPQPRELPAPVSSFPPLPPATADAPVIVSGPERVPAFPRPLEGARANQPVTVPGMQVYRVPESGRAIGEASGSTSAGGGTLATRPPPTDTMRDSGASVTVRELGGPGSMGGSSPLPVGEASGSATLPQ
ncbi:MAG TPA: hypothetical protein VLK85_32990, partial [Ramlibacter sp.]|nr:hypothetical protein [Ramlibacter sp.]